jgi:hypothetical protein
VADEKITNPQVVPFLLYADAGAAMDWLVKTFRLHRTGAGCQAGWHCQARELQLDGGRNHHGGLRRAGLPGTCQTWRSYPARAHHGHEPEIPLEPDESGFCRSVRDVERTTRLAVLFGKRSRRPPVVFRRAQLLSCPAEFSSTGNCIMSAHTRPR